MCIPEFKLFLADNTLKKVGLDNCYEEPVHGVNLIKNLHFGYSDQEPICVFCWRHLPQYYTQRVCYGYVPVFILPLLGGFVLPSLPSASLSSKASVLLNNFQISVAIPKPGCFHSFGYQYL